MTLGSTHAHTHTDVSPPPAPFFRIELRQRLEAVVQSDMGCRI